MVIDNGTAATTSDHEHDIDLEVRARLPQHAPRSRSGRARRDHLHQPADAALWFLEHELVHPDAGMRLGRRRPRPHPARPGRAARGRRLGRRGPRPDPTAVHLVNATLEGRRPTRLELDGTALRIGHRHADTPVDDALALIAEAIIEELATGRPERFRVCANDRCRWAFFDSSPTGRRRWCDMRSCGNQAKAARHRARLKEEPAADQAERRTRRSPRPEATR